MAVGGRVAGGEEAKSRNYLRHAWRHWSFPNIAKSITILLARRAQFAAHCDAPEQQNRDPAWPRGERAIERERERERETEREREGERESVD